MACGAASGPPSFLSIPQELRDKVYEVLLTPDRYSIQTHSDRPYKLEPAILGVSKAINQQAIKVL